MVPMFSVPLSELSSVSATLGRIPSMQEYMDVMQHVTPMSEEIYRYLNFDQLDEYHSVADQVEVALS